MPTLSAVLLTFHTRHGRNVLTLFLLYHIVMYPLFIYYNGGRCGHDRMVVGFTTTYAISVVSSSRI